MNTLRDEIEILRISNENSLGRNFVPEAKLFTLLTEAKIRACLRELNIADYEREELVHAITHGARRCFSILLLLNGGERITGFFKHDLMQKSNPDDRFPYTTEPLQRAFGTDISPAFIKRFMNMQWCFMVPVLRSQSILRELDKSTVLPYVREKLLGSGAMGDAYLVDLHPEYHELPIIKHQVVRKELKQSADEDIESFMRELKNVALLAHLKHSNIVKLYCSYVQDMPSRRCNFIFEVAEGGSLAGLLDGRYEGPQLEAHQVLWGLADLASAIDAVHNFVSDTLDLELTGCHHDLKPQNILIQGETLVLIDFGLSTFRNPNEDSLTLFKETRGSYIAPECQSSIDGRIKSHKVGRASDIWSFGCILSEVLTFLICGSPSVRQFRNKRVILFTEGIEWSRFHVGSGKPNPAVSEWLQYLEEKGSHESWTGHLIKLIRWILTLDPKQRPKSGQVLQAMFWIATIALSEYLSRSWEGVCSSMPSSKLCILESYRFRSWSYTFAQLPSTLDDPSIDFKSIQKTLKGEQDILNSIRACDHTTNIPLLRAIGKLNTSLVQALPFEYKSQFKQHLVDQVLQISDLNELGNMSTALKEGPDHDVGTLIAMQRLIALADQGNLTDQKDLLLEEAAVTIELDLGIHSRGRLQGKSNDIIVEWLRYDGSWADKSVSSQLLKRLSTMASLLSEQTTQSLTGTLQCQGYFHEPTRNCFGLVYLMPTTNLTPRTLYQLIDEMVPEKKKPRFRPPLEYRFRLVSDLCRSVQTLHKINWLHRNIHSMNVICLSPPGVRDAEAAQNMRLIGLGASREDTHDSFTQGHDEEAQLRNYQHPSYLGGARYRAEFDCYSLGMVLLEIGLWSTLSRLGKGFKGMDDEAFRRNIIQKYVPQLEMTMGSNYMEAVRWCVEGEPVSTPHQGSRPQSLEEMVMGRLHVL